MSSYQLITGKKYIKDLFSNENFYNIPDYQRPYVWSEDQVNDLLNDIYQAYKTNEEKEYFIGCMVWNEKKTENNIKYNDILDGQQRFLTLFLLHSVLRDITDNQTIIKKAQERLKQEGDIVDGIPERNRITFDIRNDDDFFNNFIYKNKGTLNLNELKILSSDGDTISCKNMSNSILTMHSWFRRLKTDKEEMFDDDVLNLFKYISSKVLSLYLATPDNLDDAYNLFTVLNSRGVQLQMSDILRAQNLRVIEDNSDREIYATEWDNYINIISQPYNSFDEFLYHIVYIMFKYQSDDNNNLKNAFDFLDRRNVVNKGAPTFELISRYVDHYDQIVNSKLNIGDKTSLFNNLVLILNNVYGSIYLMPLMHFKDMFGTEMICEFMVKLENLISINWMLGKRQSLTRLFILMRKIEELGSKYKETKNIKYMEMAVNCNELKYDFIDKNSLSSYKLDINEFFDMLNNENWGAFNGTKVNKTRYILLKLDLINGNVNNKIQFDKSKCSIEHLLPRQTNEVSEKEHIEWVHKLGNLVMIDRKKNSSMSNSTYTIKKEKYKKDIEYRVNTNYVFMKYESWDIANIKENHHRMIDQIKNHYLINDISSLV